MIGIHLRLKRITLAAVLAVGPRDKDGSRRRAWSLHESSAWEAVEDRTTVVEVAEVRSGAGFVEKGQLADLRRD